MQRHSRRLAEALQTVVNHLRCQFLNFSILEAEFADNKGAEQDIDDGLGNRFIKRREAIIKAAQTFAVTEGFREGFTKAQKGILDCVVVVDYCSCQLVSVLILSSSPDAFTRQ